MEKKTKKQMEIERRQRIRNWLCLNMNKLALEWVSRQAAADACNRALSLEPRCSAILIGKLANALYDDRPGSFIDAWNGAGRFSYNRSLSGRQWYEVFAKARKYKRELESLPSIRAIAAFLGFVSIPVCLEVLRRMEISKPNEAAWVDPREVTDAAD